MYHTYARNAAPPVPNRLPSTENFHLSVSSIAATVRGNTQNKGDTEDRSMKKTRGPQFFPPTRRMRVFFPDCISRRFSSFAPTIERGDSTKIASRVADGCAPRRVRRRRPTFEIERIGRPRPARDAPRTSPTRVPTARVDLASAAASVSRSALSRFPRAPPASSQSS